MANQDQVPATQEAGDCAPAPPMPEPPIPYPVGSPPTYSEGRLEQWLWNSPLPPPDVLSQYEETLPGAAERLLRMVEAESTHRRRLEERQLQSEITETRTGQWMAFLIALFTIAVGAYTALAGAQFPGALIGSGGVIGLVVAFIYGRRKPSA